MRDKLGAMRRGLLLAVLLVPPAAAQVTSRASVDSNGTQSTGDISSWISLSISADGRFVAFASEAPGLVPGDTNGVADVFLRDRRTGVTERVSVDSSGAQGNGESNSVLGHSISADGRFVAFGSLASNLVPGDTNGYGDIFVRDRRAGTTERVSVDSSGGQADHVSGWHSISADGRYVAFDSFANNLVPGDTNVATDVFVRDRVAGTTVRVSLGPGGAQPDHHSFFPSISADGTRVAYLSFARNLVPDDTNGVLDAFVVDRTRGTTTRVSVDSAGHEANDGCSYWAGVSISADGRFVVFGSDATNLVPGDTNGKTDVFVHDLELGTTERASVSATGEQGDNWSGYEPSSISADGRFVAFQSFASNLVPGFTNITGNVFVRDRVSGTTELASLGSHGEVGNGESGDEGVAISADARCVAFYSRASNLVPGEANALADVFVREREAHVFPELCRPGRDGVAGCPCSNPAARADRGCDNSAATGGATLAASGGEYLSSDSLVFEATGLVPGQTSLLLQGRAVIARGAIYGQGVRCVASPFERLYTKIAARGSIAVPDLAAGDATVHARVAAAGDPISAGSTRWYAVVYRDPVVLGGCSAASTFNATLTIAVSWRP